MTAEAPSRNTGIDILSKEFNTTEMRGTFKRAGRTLRTATETGLITPLATEQDLNRLAYSDADVNTAFSSIRRLIVASGGTTDFSELPDPNLFIPLAEPYLGADNEMRYPTIKYMPRQISEPLAAMRNAYLEHLATNLPNDWPQRPGIIPYSVYRTPYYQMSLFARRIGADGLEGALAVQALPGDSQHSFLKDCAVDVQKIGDKYGSIRTPHEEIGFEQTMEFSWLLDNAARYGFWVPYYPDDPANPGSDKRLGGKIIVEPWHWQYVGEKEAKVKMTDELKNNFRAYINARPIRTPGVLMQP